MKDKKIEVKKSKLRRIAKHIFHSFKELAELVEPGMVPQIPRQHKKEEKK